MSDWKKSEKMPGLEQSEADGRYRLRVQTTNGAQSLVLNKLYSINELETIRELMRTSLTESGRRLDRSEVPVPAATEDQTKPEEDDEDLLDELAAAEARIEELEEALAKVGGDSDAPSDGEDWRQRALDAEEKVAELERASDKQNETIDGLTLRIDERKDDLFHVRERLIEACEEWGIEDLDGLSTEALTKKVCAEYTNLYNEQTIALREAEEDARQNHALPEELEVTLQVVCERWGFAEPEDTPTPSTVKRVLMDFDALCGELDKVDPKTREKVVALETRVRELEAWQSQACKALDGAVSDDPVTPENFLEALATLRLYTDACDANTKEHNNLVGRLADARDRRKEEAREALLAKEELAAELHDVRTEFKAAIELQKEMGESLAELRGLIERKAEESELLLTACSEVLGPDRCAGILQLAPSDLAHLFEEAVLEDRGLDILNVEGEEERERVLREYAIMHAGLLEVLRHEPLEVMELSGTDKQRVKELAWRVRNEVILQNTSNDELNMEGPLLYASQAERELPGLLTKRIGQLDAELHDVRAEKEALEQEVESLLEASSVVPERERFMLMLMRDAYMVLASLEERDPQRFAFSTDARAHRFLRLAAREISTRDINHVVAKPTEENAAR